MQLLALTLPSNPVMLIFYALVVIGAAAVSGLVVGFLLRRVAMLFWKDLSQAALFRVRFIGGLGGGILAYVLLGPGGGWGPGWGGGPGDGAAEKGTGNAAPQVALAPTKTKGQPSDAAAAPEPAVLKVRLLGEHTTPPYEQADRLFAFAEDAEPRAVDLEAVMKRIKELQGGNRIKEVELLITKQSTILENPAVERLRQRVLKEARLPFTQPDPEDPFGPRKVRYAQD
jgi:hypothetical protein